MSRFPTRATALLLPVLLAGCGMIDTKADPLNSTLYEYRGVVRWSEWDRAPGFLDPLELEMEPLDATELERLKQYQITGYEVRTTNYPSEFEYQQDVELRVVNIHTQAERIVHDRQTWRWDPVAKRWWLASGLPDVNPSN